jgi:uncharacterized protein (DUF2252 family)
MEQSIEDVGMSRKERTEDLTKGMSFREKMPVESHAHFKASYRPDPIKSIIKSGHGKIENLLPMRYNRMMESPFSFYRGAAAIMAADLGRIPSSGIKVQICGDCHLMNFGGFATPERKLVFDINDFDETLMAPWEWDVKRLAASLLIAAHEKNFALSGEEAVWTMTNNYRNHMAEYAEMAALDVWYAQIDMKKLIKSHKGKDFKKVHQKILKKATSYTGNEVEFATLGVVRGEEIRIKDQPPFIYHSDDEKESFARVENSFNRYKESLSHDRRVLLNQYTIRDVVMKIGGIGSVGTWCGIVLLTSAGGEPLFLQFKQAYQSVLELFTQKSRYKHHGQRVVEGQRMMQSASDIFLGWTTGDTGRNYYVRQLRDAKLIPSIELLKSKDLVSYAAACGWALARAHARSGEAAVITGYLGKTDMFEQAITSFATTYSAQNEKDYNAFLQALRKGVLPSTSSEHMIITSI